ncbi:universal stress protein [Novipirellula artificiosorum]|uniref:Universal stress protein family protein n=1 Tax=Novipirellula artificiosorum TaxID=2528016 RepID=A0A5C6D6S9_9BACT|nr:universal stress protein [Novipirellula artificiosorum]TWU30569.1 hypothetical protein Poly41_66640 [Novipirellula artificiosorum]
MVNESESSDLGRDVDASMRMFERSKVGQAASIQPIKPSRVLWVLDGSSQDDSSLAAVTHLNDQFNLETIVLDARDASGELTDHAPERAIQVSGGRPIRPSEGEAYEKILAALAHHDVDLVIVPCPFGRSFEHVGTDSAGTVIDVLLARSPKPILVIRRDDQTLDRCTQQVSVVIGSECDVANRAAAWAFGLAADGATVTLDLVIEKEHYENIRSIIEALDPGKPLAPEQVSEALAKAHQTLHAEMAKTANERGLSYHLRPQAGQNAPPNPLHETQKMLLVMPLEVDDRFGQGFVQDRIRRSPHPVLVVPGHLPPSEA